MDKQNWDHGRPYIPPPPPPRLDTDGTAIDWDTERTRTPLDFDAPEWVALGCGVFFLALAAIGVIGACKGWWLP